MKFENHRSVFFNIYFVNTLLYLMIILTVKPWSSAMSMLHTPHEASSVTFYLQWPHFSPLCICAFFHSHLEHMHHVSASWPLHSSLRMWGASFLGSYALATLLGTPPDVLQAKISFEQSYRGLKRQQGLRVTCFVNYADKRKIFLEFLYLFALE